MSQLRQLRESLHEHGLVGPPKSKKQRKQTSKDADKRLQRHAALQGIRERFNPFEVKAPARKDKFEIISNKLVKKHGPGRPGVTKGLGEERRRDTLLKEIQRRGKTGGIVDRRFGENDPTMTPEQRAAERFARQSERKLKKSSIFNLEDEDEDQMELTHGGRALDSLERIGRDDFAENDVSSVDSDGEDGYNMRPAKRKRGLDDEDGEDHETKREQLPERKKSKNEVMQEVIAKSKYHKALHQQAKEDDEDLRNELDKGWQEVFGAMRGQKEAVKRPTKAKPPVPDLPMNPDRAALLAGKDREDNDREYEKRLRQMQMDARSKPADRTKTNEEKFTEDAERLRKLEQQRLRRMRGEPESSSEDDGIGLDVNEQEEADDAKAFGIGQPANLSPPRPELDVEDEDNFVLDDDLLASASEADPASDELDESEIDSEEDESDGDDDFIDGLTLPESAGAPAGWPMTNSSKEAAVQANGLAFTYSCPQSHEEFLEITKDTKFEDLPTVVQRIRTLHHPKLAAGNKAKLEQFSKVLAEHVAWIVDQHRKCPISVLETLIRHLHSLAKSFPEAVGSAFRARLKQVSDERPLKLESGDLIMLTAISTIFPTSDHFHSVVTPANLVLTRYLGLGSVQTLGDLATGAWCCTLALQYQTLSKRYVPELMTYVVNAMSNLSPLAIKDPRILVPRRLPEASLRLDVDVAERPGPLRRSDFRAGTDDAGLKLRLCNAFVLLLRGAADLWKTKSGFNEIITPAVLVLDHFIKACAAKKLLQTNIAFLDTIKSTTTYIKDLRQHSLDARKPLLLHNHRPLAIKTSIPKFEESYNPDRHYDPDRERSDLNKLKAEHKRERKGAMRELRKDANFIARESLREKKEKDAAYDKKFKRLVAEIQGEEGKESKEYEREKRKRKGKW